MVYENFPYVLGIFIKKVEEFRPISIYVGNIKIGETRYPYAKEKLSRISKDLLGILRDYRSKKGQIKDLETLIKHSDWTFASLSLNKYYDGVLVLEGILKGTYVTREDWCLELNERELLVMRGDTLIRGEVRVWGGVLGINYNKNRRLWSGELIVRRYSSVAKAISSAIVEGKAYLIRPNEVYFIRRSARPRRGNIDLEYAIVTKNSVLPFNSEGLSRLRHLEDIVGIVYNPTDDVEGIILIPRKFWDQKIEVDINPHCLREF